MCSKRNLVTQASNPALRVVEGCYLLLGTSQGGERFHFVVVLSSVQKLTEKNTLTELILGAFKLMLVLADTWSFQELTLTGEQRSMFRLQQSVRQTSPSTLSL